MKTIRPEQFQKAVLELLAEYGDDAYEITQSCAKSAARGAVSEIKGSAPSGGRYARGWSHKAQKNGYSKYTETVYNRTDYQLAHLLEFPHPTGKGGHYPKRVDYTGTLARIEEKYSNQFMEEVVSKL